MTGQKQPERDFLYREFTGYGGQQTIRVGDWKAVRQNLAKGRLEIELYNIRQDISAQQLTPDQLREALAEIEGK